MSNEKFIAAIQSGDAARVTKLLDADPSLANATAGPASALLLAMYHGHPEIAKLIASRRATLTAHEAAALGDVDRVRSLVTHDPTLLNKHAADGFSLLGFGTFFGHDEVDRYLLDAGADVNVQATNPARVGPVHAAAAVRNHSMMKLLLERGANPNAKQSLDYTPLHTAAARGDVEMARLLLAHGATRDAKGSDGKTPADVAREHGEATFAAWIASNEK